jgi:integrase
MNNATPDEPISINGLMDLYEREKLIKVSSRTRKDYSKYFIPRIRGLWGHRVADEMQPREFAQWLYSSPKGQIQRVRMLAPLAAAYTAGIGQWFVVTRHPLRDLKKPKNPPRDFLIEMHEFDAIVALAKPRVGLIMQLALRTGQRQGDILGLRWEQVKGMELHLRQGKTGKRLAIAIDGPLEAVLDKCWNLPNGGCAGSEWVVPSRNNRRYSSEGFRACFTRLMTKYEALGGRRPHFHDIRALTATLCPDVETARRLLGHTTIAMTQRCYRRGVERVEALKL